MLRERQLDGSIRDKAGIAIDRLKFFSSIASKLFGGFTICVSGGKDSSVITDLAIKSKCECRFVHNRTGLDYPETCCFIKDEKRRIEALGYKFNIIIPRDKNGNRITMWKLIAKKGFPTRIRRFCCEHLKESPDGEGEYKVLGIRWQESSSRKTGRKVHEVVNRDKSKKFFTNDENSMLRRMTEVCFRKNIYILNPIIDWGEAEVWEYIRENNIPYNSLYDKGYRRVGCIGCPMNSRRREELMRLPKWSDLYKKAGARYLAAHPGICKNSDGLFNRWLSNGKGVVTEDIFRRVPDSGENNKYIGDVKNERITTI